jgi:hypothetical protein
MRLTCIDGNLFTTERICMPIDDTPNYTPDRPASSVSRRGLMKTAVGAGIAVAVVGTVGIAQASPSGKHTDELTGPVTGAALTSDAAMANGPVIVHVVDSAGTLEFFAGETRTQKSDRDLAGRIGRVASASPIVVHVLDGKGSLEVFSDGTRTQIHNQDLANRIVRAA